MNAAFLLLTTAWLAGADPEKVPPPQGSGTGAPVASACGGGCGGCGGGCDSCCDSGGFLDRLRARFHRDDCGCGCEGPGLMDRLRSRFHRDDCCQPSCQPSCHTCAPACAPSCVHYTPSCSHGCGSSCSSCDCSPSLRERLRGWFNRRNHDCCDSGCGGCGGCGGVITDKKPEVVPLPKGSGTGSGTGSGEVLQRLPTGEPVPSIPPGISKETPY